MAGIGASAPVRSHSMAARDGFAAVAVHLVQWPRGAKRLAVGMSDAILGFVAVWIALSLQAGAPYRPDMVLIACGLTLLGAWYPVAIWRGEYRSIFRFAGRRAMMSLSISIACLAGLLAIGLTAVPQASIGPALAILAPLIFFLLIVTSRIAARFLLVDFVAAGSPEERQKRVLIYGAGTTGQSVASTMGALSGMRLVGFLDDDTAKAGLRLDGVRVHHASRVAALVEEGSISDIVLAIANIDAERRRAIVASLSKLPVNVQVLPLMREVMEGRISTAALRPVALEDLLGREKVHGDPELLERAVTGQRVMITGAGGSIGSEICRQIIALGPAELVLVDASEFALFNIGREIEAALALCALDARPGLHLRLADVAISSCVRGLFAEFAPDLIFHAAAYKHVPLVEDNVIEAVRNNVFATHLMARAAQLHGAKRFILVSSDKAVRPPGVMGASKRVCEIIVQDLARNLAQGAFAAPSTIFAMVRFGNVLGSSGSVVPTFRAQIEAGGPVTVTHREVTRYFMTVSEAAQLVLQAGAMAGRGARGGAHRGTPGMAFAGEVFLLDMGAPVRIWDLARTMIRLSGRTPGDADNPQGDIAIVESGLRPGEKLHEELLLGESCAPTEHPRIMQGRETCPPAQQVARVLRALEEAVEDYDVVACKTALTLLVPTLDFIPPAPLRRISASNAAPASASRKPAIQPLSVPLPHPPARLG